MTKKYRIIYADPPWPMKGGGTWAKQIDAENHYPTMSISQIAAINVGGIAEKDCALFLWVLDWMIPETLKVIEGWGFRLVKVGFYWFKTYRINSPLRIGPGYWTRNNVEACWLCTKGSPKRFAKNISQTIVYPAVKHSTKPPEIRNKIIGLMGNLPRIELFAREKAEGWDSFGNEVFSDIVLK